MPETARRLADPLFTAGLELNRYDLNDFVEKQEHFLQEVLRGLDEHSKAALALIYMRNDSLESPIDLEASEREAIERLGSNLGGCITALESLNGSLVQHTHAEQTAAWRFKHPPLAMPMPGFSSRALNYSASMFTAVQSISCWGRLPAETSVLKGLSLSPKGCSSLSLSG